MLIILTVAMFQSNVNAQVVINEILADPGMYDGQGAEWIELYNTDSGAPADVSCYVLTDGEEIIVIPDGTIIPAGGMLLIYNSTFFNCSVCNWNPAIIANLPATTISLDLSTCDCTNQTASSCFAVTFENSGIPPINNGNGERIVLFDETSTIEDAIYYGSGARVNGGAIIPESQIANSDGPSDIITGQHILGNTSTGCTLPATNDYSMPAVNADMTDNGGYTYAGPNSTSCSSSNARIVDGIASINGSGFFNDNYPTPGQSNTIADFSISYTTSGGQSGSLTNGNTTLNICLGETISFSSDINGFNQVYNDHDGDTGSMVPSGNGSYIEDTGIFVPALTPWVEAPVTSTGVTNLSYTTVAITSNTIINFQIKENTQASQSANTDTSCASGVSGISGSGNGQECYIKRDISVNIIEEITNVSYVCDNGLVTVTTSPAENFGTYSLILDNSTDNSLDRTFSVSQSPFQFQISQGTDVDYSLAISGNQNPNCSAIPTITGGALCVFTPACPEFGGYHACTDSEAAVCPGDMINISIDESTASDLPNGGVIEYVAVNSASATDAEIYASNDVLASQIVSVTTSASTPKDCLTFTPGDIALLQFDSDGSGTTEGFTFIALSDITAGTSIFFTDNGWTGSDFRRTSAGATSEGTIEWTAPIGGTAAGTIIIIDAGPNVISGGGTVTTADPGFALTGGDNLFAFCGTAFDMPTTWLSGLYANSTWDSNATSTTTTALPSTLINGETALAVATTGDDNIAYTDCGDFSSATTPILSANVIYGEINDWTTSNSMEPIANTTCDYTTNHAVTSTTTLAPICASITVPSDQCTEGDLFIAARVSPDQTGCNTGTGGPDATPVASVRAYTVSCPNAIISGEGAICAGSTAEIPVVFTNVTGCTTADITYTIDGTTSTSTGPLSIDSGIATISGLTAAGVYEITSIILAGCSGLCDVDVSGSYSLAIQALPPAPVAADQTVCSNQLSTITASGDSDLVWYDGDPTAGGNQVGNGTILNVTLSAPTTYYVRSENPDNGCFGPAKDVMITIVDLPTAIAENITVCAESQIDLNASASNGSGGYTYAWTTTSTNNFNSIIEDPTVTTSAAIPDAGTYTLYVEDSNGCFSTDDATVTVNAIPDFNPTVTQPTCTTDGMIQFAELSGGTYAYEYSTTGAAPYTSISPMSGNVTINVAEGTQTSSTYTIRVSRTDVDPDCVNTETGTVNEVTGCASCTAPSITTQPMNATVCYTDTNIDQMFSVTATNNGTGTSLNYQWQVSTDGGASFTDIVGEIMSSLTVTATGGSMNGNQYQVIITDPIDATACTITSSAATLTVNVVECSMFPWEGN